MARRASQRTLSIVAAATTVAVCGGTAYAVTNDRNTPLGTQIVGAQTDGSNLVHTGQFVTPAGDVIKEAGRPFGLALAPDGKTAAALNTGGATTGS